MLKYFEVLLLHPAIFTYQAPLKREHEQTSASTAKFFTHFTLEWSSPLIVFLLLHNPINYMLQPLPPSPLPPHQPHVLNTGLNCDFI